MFATTKLFLDYFGLKNLDDLPPLADLSDWETLRVQLDLPAVEEEELPIEMADVREMPEILLDTEEEDLDDDDDDFDVDKLPELLAETGIRNIVASDWGESPEAGGEKPDETDAGDAEDLDETASGN